MNDFVVFKDRTKGKDTFFSDINHIKKGHCFLCGKKLSSTNTSQEDLFPKWLLKKFNLYNSSITLLNGTQLKYPVLVDCCRRCNNEYLSTVEYSIERGLRGGYRTFSQISHETIFYWLAKILYGLLYKQTQLAVDRRNPKSGTIIPPQALEQLSTFHSFLKTKTKKVRWFTEPWSIYIFHLQEYKKHTELNYTFMDNPSTFMVSMRMGDVGIIASLQDGGALEQLDFANIQKIKLHPLQFQEVTAAAFYSRQLLNRTPKYITAKRKNQITIIPMSLQGLSSKPIFDSWKNSEYASYLSQFTGLPVEFFYDRSKDIVRTAILRNGKPRFIKLEEDQKLRRVKRKDRT